MSSGSLFVIRVKGGQGVDDAPPNDRHWLHSLGTCAAPLKTCSTALVTDARTWRPAALKFDGVFRRLRVGSPGFSPRLRSCILAVPAYYYQGIQRAYDLNKEVQEVYGYI